MDKGPGDHEELVITFGKLKEWINAAWHEGTIYAVNILRGKGYVDATALAVVQNEVSDLRTTVTPLKNSD